MPGAGSGARALLPFESGGGRPTERPVRVEPMSDPPSWETRMETPAVIERVGNRSPGAVAGQGQRAEGGFALIAALLALVGITALATAGFLVSDTDYRVATNHRTSVDAFYASDAALNEFLGTQGFPSSGRSYTYGSETAVVRNVHLLDLPDGQKLFLMTANGRHARGREGTAERTTRAMGLYTPLPLNVPGAFTAVNGLRKNGGAGIISGSDAAPPGMCPDGIADGGQATIAGVAVPPGGYKQHGGKLVPTGDPPIADTLTSYELVQFSEVDWGGVVTESKVEPDYVVPADPWPDFTMVPVDEWPVIHVTADSYNLGPGHSGWGTIILDGNVSMNGAFVWNGIILAGGRLVSDGAQEIWGAMYTGLNRLLGESVSESEVGNGYKVFRYNSCNVEAAKRSMGWLSQRPGSWHEDI